MIQLEKWLNQSPEPTSEFREKIHNTFSVLVDLAHDKKLNDVFNTPNKMSPIEFIMICVLVAVQKDKLTPSQLSAAIGKMRVDARKKHVDIRMNYRVGKTMMEFIRAFKASKSKDRDDGEMAGSLAKAGKKRKRLEQVDVNRDEDIVMEPPASPKDVRPPKPQASHSDSASSAPRVVSKSVLENGLPDRLAAIRAAKEKLASAPISIPTAAPMVLRPNAPAAAPTLVTKTESNALESALMARMNSSLSLTSNRAEGGDSWLGQSRHTSPRARSRSRDREKDRERDRDRANRRRSVSAERSTRRPYDGTRDYKSHRVRDVKYTGSRRDSKAGRDDYR
jgi:hypothetical protein